MLLKVIQMKKDETFVLGLFLGMALVIGFLGFVFLGDDSHDMINTRALGKILCQEQGMEYGHREIKSTEVDGRIESNIPKIHCKPIQEEELVDGIVVGYKKERTQLETTMGLEQKNFCGNLRMLILNLEGEEASAVKRVFEIMCKGETK